MAKRMTHYTIVRDEFTSHFVEKVEKLLAEGWELWGRPWGEDYFNQALVMREEEDE